MSLDDDRLIILLQKKTTTHMEAFPFPTMKRVQHMGKLVCVTMYPKNECQMRTHLKTGER